MASRFEMWMEHNFYGHCVDMGLRADEDNRLYSEEDAEVIPGLDTNSAHQVSDELIKT